MSAFNHNIKFIRQKEGLSQQKMGELLGATRGKIASYEESVNASDELKIKLAELFHLSLSKLLTTKMSNDNYLSFKEDDSRKNHQIAKSSKSRTPIDHPEYIRKSDIIDMLMDVKTEKDDEKRNQQIDNIIKNYGKVLEEIGLLRSELGRYQSFLIEKFKIN